MYTDELFIDGSNLPKPLSKQEVYGLLDKIKQGDEEARTKLVEHNIRLVLYEVTGRFKYVEYDKKDLVSIGNIGLMKAITTFDTSKNIEFATYATRCIDNEILMFLRSLKKDKIIDSLDRIITHDSGGNELKIGDTIIDETDMVEEYTDNETYHIIRQIVKELPERDRQIIMLYFGFGNNKVHNQKEIADMFSISQSHVSRLLLKIVKQIGNQLEQRGVIELRKEVTQKTKCIHKEKENKTIEELQPIYNYFYSYTREQVDAMLEALQDEEKEWIILRCGANLNNPKGGKLNKEEVNKFYKILIPKMEQLLINLNKGKRTIVDRDVVTEITVGNKIEKSNVLVEEITFENSHLIKQDINSGSASIATETMSKEDYLKALEVLRTPAFTKTIGAYSPKEAVIISLKLGYVDGKCFSTDAISCFLGIEQQEIISATKKVLLAYREKTNQAVEKYIQIISKEKEITAVAPVKLLNK